MHVWHGRCLLIYSRVYPSQRTTLECTCRTVGKVCRPFTPSRTLFAHYSHSRRIVFTAIRTLFARYSHGLTLFAHYSIRTVAHYSHTVRTVAHYAHGRTLFAHYSRGSHTIRAIVTPSSHTIRTSLHPGHTIRAVGASRFAVFALSSRSIRKVHICECAICTL